MSKVLSKTDEEKIVQVACDLICKFEGFSSSPYTCPSGYKTIGYGERMSLYDTRKQVTEEEAREFVMNQAANILKKLRQDLGEMEYIHAGERYIGNDQYAALISFVYNVGWENYRRSTLRQRIIGVATNDIIQKEWLRWTYARGKKLKGLKNRREAEYQLFIKTKY